MIRGRLQMIGALGFLLPCAICRAYDLGGFTRAALDFANNYTKELLQELGNFGYNYTRGLINEQNRTWWEIVAPDLPAAILKGYLRRKDIRSRLPLASHDALELPLLGARMSFLAYAPDATSLAHGLGEVDTKLRLLHFEPQQNISDGLSNPQWYIAYTDDATFIVFRGTWSSDDAILDFWAKPKVHESLKYHSGFLSGVEAVKDKIMAKLLAHMSTRRAHASKIYVFGHSLGGALAMTFFAQGNLHNAELAHTDKIVMTYGAPKVLHPPCDAVPEGRVLAIVNEADMIPKLLGSPLPILKGLLDPQGISIHIIKHLLSKVIPFDVLRDGPEDILKIFESYVHPDQVELLYLEQGRAYHVPPDHEEELLHLHEALSPNALAHHGLYETALIAASQAAPPTGQHVEL